LDSNIVSDGADGAKGYGTYGVELNDRKGCSAAVAFSL
jgi:hypothetical protein